MFLLWARYADRMSEDVKNPPILPEPWVDRTDLLRSDGSGLNDEIKLLEKFYERMRPEGQRRLGDIAPVGHTPPVHVMAENRDTEVRIILTLANMWHEQPGTFALSAQFELQPLAVYFFSRSEFHVLSGTDFRQLPVQSICSAYSFAFAEEIILGNRELLLQEGPPYDDYVVPVEYRENYMKNSLNKLPVQYVRKPWFYALVAVQYDAVFNKFPDVNTADKMAEINSSVAKSTVQRWIAKARKMNLLAPARLVK